MNQNLPQRDAYAGAAPVGGASTDAVAHDNNSVSTDKIWQVITASSVGTVIEWYDFYIFGSLAAIIGPVLFGSKKANGRADVDRFVARLTNTGRLDPTFNDGGLHEHDVDGLNDNPRHGFVQADGKIVMSGYTSRPTGALLADVDLLYGRSLPDADSRWLWEVAPFGEEARDRRRVHTVVAFPDWHAASQ